MYGAIRLLHDLNGIAGFMQAKELASLAGAAEDALRNGNAKVMPVLFNELQVAMQTVKAAFHHMRLSMQQLRPVAGTGPSQ